MSSADRGEAIGTSVFSLHAWPQRYVFALVVVGAATLVRYALGGLLGPNLPFLLFYPAILAVSWLAGQGPGFFAVLLSDASASYFFFAPATPAGYGLPHNGTGLLIFSIAGVATSGLADLYRQRTQRLREFERAAAGLEEGIIIVDRRYRYVVANRAFLSYRGIEKDRVIGRSLAELMGETVFETTVKPQLDQCFRGKVVKFQKRYVYPALGERDFSVSYFPIEGPTGVDRVVCILQDITEQKQAERSSALFRTLIDHSGDAVEVIDPETMRFLDVNQKSCQDLGYSREELFAMTVFDIDPEVDESVRTTVLERLQKSGSLVRQGVHRRKDGSTFPVETSIKLVQLDRSYLVAVSRDITDRRNAQDALRSREENYRNFVSQSSEGIFRQDLDAPLPIDMPEDELVRHILLDSYMAECNDAMAKMYGLTVQNFVGMRLTATLDPNDPHNVELCRDYVRSGFRVVERESHEVDVHGNPKVFLNSMIGIVENGMLLRTWGIQRDVTERVKAEEGRAKAERSLAESEERFRVALRDSPITVFNQDRDLRYTWIYNPQLYLQKDVIGKTDDEIMGLKKAARLDDLKRQVLKTGVAVREEVMIAHNAKNYAFDMAIEPLFDSEKKVVGITGTSMDVARLRDQADRLQDARDKLAQEKSYLEGEIQTELGFEKIIGQSPALREVLKKARIVAPTDSTVLLLGETGTGKELVARSVHALSSRHGKTFIKLNCAAVPSGLLESELFGHEKGAFTGAVSQKVGRVELADKGTLFLDEIGELPLELQPKLLRVLQDREFERLGGIHTLRVDVRIISATNRNLRQDIADKMFREDLYYRLNVFPIELPPLRERRSDIPVLVNHFVRKHSVRMGKHIESVPDETMAVLQNWNWPGNIRELENMIERMVILSKDDVLAPPAAELGEPQDLLEDNLTEMERDHIIRVLREVNGVLSGVDGAASRLGIKRTTLQSMLKRFGIEPQEYRRGTGT